MPYPRRDPVPIGEMDRSRYEGHFSICQKLRDMFHKMNEPEIDREEIKLNLRVAMAMAKAMNKKLQDYKHKEEEEKRKCQLAQ
jgi:hypothetical protein